MEGSRDDNDDIVGETGEGDNETSDESKEEEVTEDNKFVGEESDKEGKSVTVRKIRKCLRR